MPRARKGMENPYARFTDEDKRRFLQMLFLNCRPDGSPKFRDTERRLKQVMGDYAPSWEYLRQLWKKRDQYLSPKDSATMRAASDGGLLTFEDVLRQISSPNLGSVPTPSDGHEGHSSNNSSDAHSGAGQKGKARRTKPKPKYRVEVPSPVELVAQSNTQAQGKGHAAGGGDEENGTTESQAGPPAGLGGERETTLARMPDGNVEDEARLRNVKVQIRDRLLSVAEQGLDILENYLGRMNEVMRDPSYKPSHKAMRQIATIVAIAVDRSRYLDQHLKAQELQPKPTTTNVMNLFNFISDPEEVRQWRQALIEKVKEAADPIPDEVAKGVRKAAAIAGDASASKATMNAAETEEDDRDDGEEDEG